MPRAEPRGRRVGVRGLRAALTATLVLAACSSGPVGPGAPDPDPAPEVVGPAPGPDRAEVELDDPDPGPTVPHGLVPAAPTDPDTDVPETRDELVAVLDDAVERAAAAAPEAEFGVLVTDEAGREIVARGPDAALLPASTLKTVTAAAVLTTLGPDATLTTVVDATAGVDQDGVLDGDLLLIGVGDPTLATDEYGEFVYPDRPRTSLASLADQIAAAGISEVTGAVRGTAPRFEGEPRPSGWRDSYFESFDGRFVSGLTVDGGLRTLVTRPADDGGDDAEDDAEREPSEAEEDGAPLADETEVPAEVRTELAGDPAVQAVEELVRLLDERDVEVAGGAAVGGEVAPSVGRLARVSSPAMSDVLRFLVQRSDNHLADQLFQVLGTARTGVGSWSAGERAALQVLTRFGIDTDGAVLADGSGLSRDDRLTPRMLVDLDRAMTSSPRFSASWRRLQAVTGESGTLRTRLAGTPAAGRFLGKTGTLRDVAALTGQVVAPDVDPREAAGAAERRFHLAVLVNGAEGAALGVARAVTDETILALVAELDGCALAPLDDDDGPLGRPPAQVVC
jgi:serine-type D-Ala-D-Ala carboxypeptidase/endopeptidase (penicillin-binding protein 4)